MKHRAPPPPESGTYYSNQPPSEFIQRPNRFNRNIQPFDRTQFLPLVQNIVTELQTCVEPAYNALGPNYADNRKSLVRHVADVRTDFEMEADGSEWTKEEMAGWRLCHHMTGMMMKWEEFRNDYERFAVLLREAGLGLVDREKVDREIADHRVRQLGKGKAEK